MASERFQRRIESLLDEADEAIARYDWEAVRQAALAVLAIDPENSDGLTFLATVERALGRTQDSSSTEPATSTPTSAPTLYHPTSFANGRYQVKQFLGAGGKKEVYLAHGRHPGPGGGLGGDQSEPSPNIRLARIQIGLSNSQGYFRGAACQELASAAASLRFGRGPMRSQPCWGV